MVLIYPEFDADTVFKWARERNDRISVLIPAPPMVTKCLSRILREVNQRKTVLVWGDPACLENLRHRLASSGVEIYDFVPERVVK